MTDNKPVVATTCPDTVDTCNHPCDLVLSIAVSEAAYTEHAKPCAVVLLMVMRSQVPRVATTSRAGSTMAVESTASKPVVATTCLSVHPVSGRPPCDVAMPIAKPKRTTKGHVSISALANSRHASGGGFSSLHHVEISGGGTWRAEMQTRQSSYTPQF